MWQFILLFSRQGKVRLQKWYNTFTVKEKKKIVRDLLTTILARKPKMCSFLEYKDMKICYKRYASLYFVVGIESGDNELISLEMIHRYVELLDKYFGNVCELDIIFNFEKILPTQILKKEERDSSLGKKKILHWIRKGFLMDLNFRIFILMMAYYMLDELILGGEIQETSKKRVLSAIQFQDSLQEDSEIKQALEQIGLM